jgi:hypothetical protein
MRPERATTAAARKLFMNEQKMSTDTKARPAMPDGANRPKTPIAGMEKENTRFPAEEAKRELSGAAEGGAPDGEPSTGEQA